MRNQNEKGSILTKDFIDLEELKELKIIYDILINMMRCQNLLLKQQLNKIVEKNKCCTLQLLPSRFYSPLPVPSYPCMRAATF